MENKIQEKIKEREDDIEELLVDMEIPKHKRNVLVAVFRGFIKEILEVAELELDSKYKWFDENKGALSEWNEGYHTAISETKSLLREAME